MYTIGIDIGTTSITTLLIKEDKFVEVKTDDNIFLCSNNAYEMLQDPNRIYEVILNHLNYFFNKYIDIRYIGITGQMHGFLYVSDEIEPLSNLFTWCDQRGKKYLDEVEELTKINVPVGYGLLTHYFNIKNNLVPNCKYTLLTIHDYVAFKLTNNNNFLMHSSNAASFGLFDLKNNKFFNDKLKFLFIDSSTLPSVTSKKVIVGSYKQANVTIAIGDNQASYYGATMNKKALLINFGTGSQVSLKTNDLKMSHNLEIRPYLNGNYLLVGASLCGGKSFEALAKFFSSVTNKSLNETYDKMTSIKYKKTTLKIYPYFLGTRKNYSIKASINNLDLNNFYFEDFVIATLQGMVDELYNYVKDNEFEYDYLVGSGNGIRKNKLLCEIIQQKFNKKLFVNDIKEEAAYGCALYASKGV